ncbi:uncharacterized protein LOC135476512 [Liolophura sinensis]|uniref:uncharacterized protein LOC135476512 n=1 Tax=Liolophura sinensis TaxID=3198878 RepID=UPI0031586598
MASGVKVSPEAEATIAQLRSRALRCALFKINDDCSQIVTDKTYPKEDFGDGATGEDILDALKKELPEKEPRYALLDFSFVNEESHARESVVFVAWSPDSSQVKKKMLYAASKGYIQKAAGNVKIVQATDPAELDFKEVRSKCLK